MPVVPQLRDRDYLTTQAIADFLATHRSLQLDGIIFPSAQRSKGPHGASGRNVTLFNKASMVMGSAPGTPLPYGVQLFEYEGAVAGFAPQIFTSDAKGAGPQTSPTTWLPSAISGGKPALELNLATIEIHEVRSVDVTTDPHKVFQHR
jgi:RES domain